MNDEKCAIVCATFAFVALVVCLTTCTMNTFAHEQECHSHEFPIGDPDMEPVDLGCHVHDDEQSENNCWWKDPNASDSSNWSHYHCWIDCECMKRPATDLGEWIEPCYLEGVEHDHPEPEPEPKDKLKSEENKGYAEPDFLTLWKGSGELLYKWEQTRHEAWLTLSMQDANFDLLIYEGDEVPDLDSKPYRWSQKADTLTERVYPVKRGTYWIRVQPIGDADGTWWLREWSQWL